MDYYNHDVKVIFESTNFSRTMHWSRLQFVILVALVACVHSVVPVERPSQVKTMEKSSQNSGENGESNRRGTNNTKQVEHQAEDEERWKIPGVSLLMSYFRKKPNTVDALKENRAVAKILSDNPALAKSLQNKPELSKSFQEVQKNPALMNRIKSFEKNSVATSRLKNVLGENPRGLTEKSVTKLGAVVNKSPRKYDDEEGVLFACGLMMLLILGGGITIAVLAPEKF